ncbi:BCCT family transporter [Staphylococcus aureus]
MGALQINGGLHYLFNVPNNTFVQAIIIIVVTILFYSKCMVWIS